MIERFISMNNRNRLIISRKKIENYQYIDVGYDLGEILLGISSENILKEIYDAVIRLMRENFAIDEKIGKYIAITNIGILFEPELELNISAIVDTISKEQTLIIHFEGEIDEGQMYFLRKGSAERIDLGGITHIVI